MTHALIESLRSNESNTLTYERLAESISEKFSSQPYIIGTDLTIQIFKDFLRERNVHAVLEQIKQEPLRQMAVILKRLIEQRNGFDPDGTLNLGIIQYVLNEPEASLAALESALAQVSEQQSKIADQHEVQQDYPEFHYWLGRILYESSLDPARTVSELRFATQKNPTNVAAHYYLGQALRSLMKQEFMTEAEEAFNTYLNSGSPLGHRKELQEFLKERSSK